MLIQCDKTLSLGDGRVCHSSSYSPSKNIAFSVQVGSIGHANFTFALLPNSTDYILLLTVRLNRLS